MKKIIIAAALIISCASFAETPKKEKPVLEWSVQPQLGIIKGDYYKNEKRFRQGHLGTLEVVKKDERKYIESIDSNTKMALLTTSNIDKTMEPILYEIGPKGESGRSFYTHNGEEFIFIIEGKLDVYIDETVYSLNEGDSLYFKSSQKHRFKNTTDKLTRAIWVVNPPTF